MILQKITDSIFTIEDFLIKSECINFMVLSERNGYEPAKVNTHSGAKLLTHIRNNNRSFYKNKDVAQSLWQKARSFIPTQIGNRQAIGLNELFRFYRYQQGHRFNRHFDESYIRNDTEASCMTFMIYLNDNFQGGETIFDNISIRPKQGMALLFSHNLYHAGSEVNKGVKYVLRTDVMYRVQGE
ncbi:2OG-Fe(II) oxygenase [Hymenobacter crusticola]|uniref:Fe2OG dioxygenase domain-containing protein n=1 Tax=Hymenobacter crusticola TaxID=1770526 RepID=A0A243W665_9BACT|nr:2OG-Fe(II) oxygenase [Hymenobacter crusticola]OUJ69393.1 hypothetical protein BXP70_26515 [Hymenobacter crusticola]